MANTNAPNGFQIWRRMDGGSPTMGLETRTILSTYNVAIGYGDPVIPVSTGYIQRATASTVQFAGIFFGCKYLNTAVGRVVWSPFWPGTAQGSDAEAYVVTDPQVLFVAQTLNTAITFANIGENVNVAIGTPSSVTGMSTSTVDQSTLNTTNTLPFRVYGLLSDYETTSGAVNGTDNSSAYNRVILQPNNWSRRQLEGIA